MVIGLTCISFRQTQSTGVRRAVAGGADRVAVPLLRLGLRRGAPEPRPRPPREGLPAPPDQVPAPRMPRLHDARQECWHSFRICNVSISGAKYLTNRSDCIVLLLLRLGFMSAMNGPGLPFTPPSACTAPPTVQWKAATPGSSIKPSAATSKSRTSARPPWATSSTLSREARSSVQQIDWP